MNTGLAPAPLRGAGSASLHCHPPDSGVFHDADDHGHDGHHHATEIRPLVIAVAISIALFFVEIIGSALTGSLALLADSGHILTDVVALLLALGAAWLARKPASASRTFGFRRAEVIAAFANALLVIVVGGFIIFEAIQRVGNPEPVAGGPLLILAVFALSANLIALRLLGHGGGLNVRAAYLHVLGDVLGSVGVIVAAVCALFFQLYLADPLISLGISALLIFSAGRLLWESVNVLLLAAPAAIDTREIERAIYAVPGVVAVHDLHIWTVSSGFVSFSCHAAIDPEFKSQGILTRIGDVLRNQFHIEHATIQVEDAGELAFVHPGCEPCEAAVE